MKISERQVYEISQNIQCGMKTYINRETGEIKSIPDIVEMYWNIEIWQEELEKIDNEWAHFSVIEKMKSWEEFQIMVAFIEEIQDERLKENIVKVLNRKRPFANFKARIETSPYRQNWFDFRNLKYEEYVEQKLKEEQIEVE